jgi:hypothetical protein
MSVVVFDVELAGDNKNDVMYTVIVHHESFEKIPFPISHILNVAADEFGWQRPWIELRSQTTGEAFVLIQYEKIQNQWVKASVSGTIPEINTRVDLYLLDHCPNRAIDALFDIDPSVP